MDAPKTMAEIEQMIQSQVQENIHLDYKDSRALINNSARDSLAKDVSAFANSDGGVLVYGVMEKNNLPVQIDSGIEDAQCSREWIEAAVMTGITPRLDDVRIHPIPVSVGHSAYSIEIAKSFRGPHQASDKRYYKRHNFKSVPMEDYEVTDVRNRRRLLSPLVVFRVSEYRRFIAAFDVGNVGSVVAEDVKFAFSVLLPWPLQGDGKPPVLFSQGTGKFPPQQWFRFLYCPFHEILSGAKSVPMEFSINVSYYHPEAASRVSDDWHVNFGVYLDSTGVRSEMEEHAKDVVEHLDKLNKNIDLLHKDLDQFKTLRGSTGLDLSIPTILNLRRTLRDGLDPEKIDPSGCEMSVFREVLAVDIQMASLIFNTLVWQNAPDKLDRIPGMTSDLLEKIYSSFVLPPRAQHDGGKPAENS